MNSISLFYRAAWAVSFASLAACGGGGGGAAGNGTADAFGLDGNLGKGAAFGGATIAGTDSQNNAFTCPTLSDETTGAYTCSVASTYKPPFILSATRDGETYYSVVTEATKGQTTKAHITPLTSAIVGALADSGNPADVKPAAATTDAITTATGKVQEGLAAVITATLDGAKFDPFKDPDFKPSTSTGMDKLLDAVKVTSTGTGVQIALAANPEVTTTIKKSEAAPAPIPKVKVDDEKTTLDAKPPALIDAFLSNIKACYALPVADRVTDGTNSGSTIKSEACKALFASNDPSLYKSFGATVSPTGVFTGLFKEEATNTTFSRGNLEYVIKNPGQPNDGAWVVSYTATTPLSSGGSNVQIGNWVMKFNPKSGETPPNLKLLGNQFAHDGQVYPTVQQRYFVGRTESNYVSTGYVLNVNDRIVNGSSIYKQVTVTTPDGKNTFTLKPSSSCSFLGLVKSDNLITCTNFVRISSAYSSAPTTPVLAKNMPSVEQAGLVFKDTPMTDAEIAQIPDNGAWTFKYELADGTTVTQTSRTLVRAATLAEISKMAFPEVTKEQLADADFQSHASAGGYTFDGDIANNSINLTGPNNGSFWYLPTGAIAPYQVTVYGRAPKVGNANGSVFNDTLYLSSSATKVIITCSQQSNTDKHCDSQQPTKYAAGTTVNQVQLNAMTGKGMLRSKQVVLYNPAGSSFQFSVAKAAGTYTVQTFNMTVNGEPDDSVRGSLELDATGKVILCDVGGLKACSGQLVLSDDKAKATFTLNVSGSGKDANGVDYTQSGTFVGEVNSSYVASGAISATLTKAGSSFPVAGKFTAFK